MQRVQCPYSLSRAAPPMLCSELHWSVIYLHSLHSSHDQLNVPRCLAASLVSGLTSDFCSQRSRGCKKLGRYHGTVPTSHFPQAQECAKQCAEYKRGVSSFPECCASLRCATLIRSCWPGLGLLVSILGFKVTCGGI